MPVAVGGTILTNAKALHRQIPRLVPHPFRKALRLRVVLIARLARLNKRPHAVPQFLRERLDPLPFLLPRLLLLLVRFLLLLGGQLGRFPREVRFGGAGFVSVTVCVSVRDRSMGGRSSRSRRARFGTERRRSRSGRCAGRARGRSGRRDTRRCRRCRGWRGLDMRLRVKRRLCRGAPARSGLRACVDLGEIRRKVSESPLASETRHQSGGTHLARLGFLFLLLCLGLRECIIRSAVSQRRRERRGLTKAFETSFPSEISPIQSSNALPPNI